MNFIWPFLMILGAVGFMFGAGGGALIAKTLGEGKHEKAQRLFSMFVYVTAGCGIGIGILGMLLIRPVARLLGAEGIMLENCVIYGRIILSALPLFMLQYEFQTFFITAQKPRLGLAVTVVSGITNMVMDYLFMAVFGGGSGSSHGHGLKPVSGRPDPPGLFFFRPNGSLFRLGKASLDKRALAKACINGSSELMSNISMSLVGMLYNLQLLKYAGEDGVAAYGVPMYVNMVFLSIFIGYSTGVAPVVGFHFGAGNRLELHSLLKKSSAVILVSSAAMFGAAELLGRPLAQLFVGYDPGLMELTARGFLIYSFSFLFSGIAIFGSAFFTALNDGLTSAAIAF